MLATKNLRGNDARTTFSRVGYIHRDSGETSLSPAQTSSSPLQAQPTQSPSTQGLSTGAQVGIGCGVALGAILLGTIAFYLFRSRKRKATSQAIELQGGEQRTKFSAGLQGQIPILPTGIRPTGAVVELESDRGIDHRSYELSNGHF
ncbi:hypothetical protein F5Y11DRAFT_345988 [Daldinia sp. FL1419]|nr:hypothetical protein F5Y11DRAFT_345988 [Daldinia sp. FL1419]